MKKLVIGITSPDSVVLLEGQLAYFKQLGYDTYLLAPDHVRTREFCRAEGCKLLPTPIERDISFWKDIRSTMVVIRHFLRIKPDIVNVGTPKMGLIGMLAAAFTRVPTRIYTCRGFRFEHERGGKKQLLMMMEKLASLCSQHIICISPSVRQLGIDMRVFPAKKTVVIGQGSSNGLDLTRFHPSKVDTTEKTMLREALKIDGTFVYGFVGRLVDRKGIQELYNAFLRLYALYPFVRLLVVGPVEAKQIANPELISNMEAHPSILMMGFQRDVPLYLSVMDVFVLPAWWEGFGNVLVQAAAMGLPIISTNATGCKDAVSDGYNGILVAPKSEEALFKAMEMLYLDEQLRLKYGTNGLTWVQRFDSQTIWKGMADLYEKKN